MSEPKYTIQWVSDMFGMLVDNCGRSPLEKAFKKDSGVKAALFETVKAIESFNYEEGVKFAFDTKRFKTVKRPHLSLIEIRKLKNTWRVLTYWDRGRKKFVMLNAFEAHKNKTLNKFVNEQKELIAAACEQLGKE